MDNTAKSDAGQTPTAVEPQQPKVLTFESEFNIQFILQAQFLTHKINSSHFSPQTRQRAPTAARPSSR